MEAITIERLAEKVREIGHLVVYVGNIEEAREINHYIGDMCINFKEYLTPRYEKKYPLFIRVNYDQASFHRAEINEGIRFYKKYYRGIPIYNIQEKYNCPGQLIKNIDVPVLSGKYWITQKK